MLFGVYFAKMADEVSIGFAMVAAACTSFVMTALQNVSDHVECLFDNKDLANEFIEVAYPMYEIKMAMKIAGDEEVTEEDKKNS